MIWEYLTNCCSLAEASLDGRFGWFWEVATLCLIILVFNFIFKRVLIALEKYFNGHGRIWEESFVSALYTPLSYYIWYFAAVEFAGFLMHQLLGRDFVTKRMFLAAGLVFAFSWFLLRWKARAVKSLVEKHKLKKITSNKARVDVIDKLLTVVIIIITLMMLLEVTGNSLNTLMAFGGISGLALAFASQEVISSFFGGLMIYINQPFQVGDWIILPEKSIEGHVEEIGWYTTRIRTLDKRPLYVPNAIFNKAVVVNPSRMSHRQIKETIGIRYRDEAELKGIITDVKEMLSANSDIDRNMSCGVYFTAFGAYSLDILISCYTTQTASEGFSKVKEKILFEIMEILKKHHAELAYPTTCVERSDAPAKEGPLEQEGDTDVIGALP